MSAISKDSIRFLANEMKDLMDAMNKYQKEKDEYCGYDWYNDGSGRELQDDIDFQAGMVRDSFDTIIENKIKEMMNVT